MDSDHLPEVRHKEVPPQSLSSRSPQAGGTRGVTVESRHPLQLRRSSESTPLGFRAVPAAIQPCPLKQWTRAGRVAGAPPSSDLGASVLNPRARVLRPLGSAEQASERVVRGEPEVRVSRPKADASSQAWPRQRLRVAAPCPVASRSSSPSLTCSSSLSL